MSFFIRRLYFYITKGNPNVRWLGFGQLACSIKGLKEEHLNAIATPCYKKG